MKTIYHGTNSKESFDQLKPSGVSDVIWFTDDREAAAVYARKYYNKGEPRVFEAEIKPSAKILDLRDISNPIVKEIRDMQSMKMGRGMDYKIPDEKWDFHAGYHLFEDPHWSCAEFLKEQNIDIAIVKDQADSFLHDHLSYAVINPSAIEMKQVVEAAEKEPRFKWKKEILDDGDGFEINVTELGTGKTVGNITVTRIHNEGYEPDEEAAPEIDIYRGEDFFPEMNSYDNITDIHHLNVEDAFQGQGVAKYIYNLALQEIKKRYPDDPIFINASPMGGDISLEDLIKFYQKAGFKVLKKYAEHRNAALWLDDPKKINLVAKVGTLEEEFKRISQDEDFYNDEYLDYFEGEVADERGWFDHQVQEFFSRLANVKYGPHGAKVWRAVMAPSLEAIDLKSLGPSWTYRKDAAHSWYGGGGKKFVLEAELPEHGIDLEVTLRQNIVNPDEEEFRTEDNAAIFLTAILDESGKVVKNFTPPLETSSGTVGATGDWMQRATSKKVAASLKKPKASDLKDALSVLMHAMPVEWGDEGWEKQEAEYHRLWKESLAKAKMQTWSMAKALKLFKVTDNRRRVEGKPLENPIIVGVIDKKDYVVLDGNHRFISKAEKGADSIDCLMVPLGDWADDLNATSADILGAMEVSAAGHDKAGIEDTDFPYYHVSTHPDQPVVPKDLVSKPGGRRGKIEPHALFLFIKGEKVEGNDGYMKRPYRWDAKLKPGTKTINAYEVGRSFDQEINFEKFMEHGKEHVEDYRRAREDFIDWCEGGARAEDDKSFRDWIEERSTGWEALVCSIADSTKLTEVLKAKGIQAIIDESGQNFFPGEPQVCVLDLSCIEWGKREDNVVDPKVYKLSGELDWSDMWVKTQIAAQVLEGIIKIETALADWSGRWIHYSKIPEVKINPKQFHQDPAGIYLFPEDFKTMGNWQVSFPYKFEVKLKPDLKILDLSTLTRPDMEKMFEQMTGQTLPNYTEWGSGEEGAQSVDRWWEALKNFFILKDGKQAGAWNKAFRDLGYDAIFDDTDSIHNSEVQLLVLDPRAVASAKIINDAPSVFETIKQITQVVKDLCEPFGHLEVKEPKKVKDWGDTKLKADIRVEESGNEVTWGITPSQQKGDHLPNQISVRLDYDSKGLRREMSRGVSLPFLGWKTKLAELTREILSVMNKVFSKKATSDYVGPAGNPNSPQVVPYVTHPMDDPFLAMNKVAEAAKQVGILYHFTTPLGFYQIVEDGWKLRTVNREQLSFTRDFNLEFNAAADEHNEDGESTGNSHDVRAIVRITVDGNKLSEKYKIKPFADGGPYARQGGNNESEQIIPGTEADIGNAVLEVDLLNGFSYEKEYGEEFKYLDHNIQDIGPLCREHGIEFNKVGYFTPYLTDDKKATGNWYFWQSKNPYNNLHPMDDPNANVGSPTERAYPWRSEPPGADRHPDAMKLETSVGVPECKKIAQWYMDNVFKDPNLQMPDFKIADQLTASWLGRCEMKWEWERPLIRVQKSILGDEKTLDRIIAHEMIHAWQFTCQPDMVEYYQIARENKGRLPRTEALNLKRRVEPLTGHRGIFQEWADKINQIKGPNYVSEVSDETYVKTDSGKEFYIFLEKQSDGALSVSTFVRPSPQIREEMKRRGETKETKLFKTGDQSLLMAKPLGKFGGNRYRLKDEERNRRIQELWDSGKTVTAVLEEDPEVIEAKLKVDYHTVMCSAENCVPHDLVQKFQDCSMMIPSAALYGEHPYKTDSDGRETEPHVTVLYGIKNAEDLPEIETHCATLPPLKFRIGNISAFRNGDKPYDVLKVAVTSPSMESLHYWIRENFDNACTFPFSGHMTLAYIKKGTCQDLEGPCDWTGETYTCDMLTFSHKTEGLTDFPMNRRVQERVAAITPREKIDLHSAAEFLSRDEKDFIFDKYETMDPRDILVDGSNWMDPKRITRWSFGWGKDMEKKELAEFLRTLTHRDIYERLLAEKEFSPVILVDDYEFGLTLADGWGRAILKYFLGEPIKVARYHTVKPPVTSAIVTAAPTMETLKKNKKPLSKEERDAVMKAGAVWHHGPNGEETPAVQKAVIKGKEWFWCNTHRAMQVKPTLKGAIKAFEFIKTTAKVEAAEFKDEGHVGNHWGSQASGVLFKCGDNILLLKRAHWTMDPLLWGVPGGAVPVDENKKPMDVKESAIREVSEEIGGFPDGAKWQGSVVFKDGKFKYTTYLVSVPEEFDPVLNNEHSDAKWYPVTELPPDIHPGVAWAVKMFGNRMKK